MNRIKNNFWIVFETGQKFVFESPKEHYLFTVIKAQMYNLASRDKQITGDHVVSVKVRNKHRKVYVLFFQ